MTVELRHCETCGVIVPVNRDRPGPARYLCENCRSAAQPIEAVKTETIPVASRGPSSAQADLAATQPVERPPRSRVMTETPHTGRPSPKRGPARRRGGGGKRWVLLGLAVAAPVLLGAVILSSTIRERGFAVQGTPGEMLHWLGETAERGASQVEVLILGTRAGQEVPGPADPPVAAEHEEDEAVTSEGAQIVADPIHPNPPTEPPPSEEAPGADSRPR